MSSLSTNIVGAAGRVLRQIAAGVWAAVGRLRRRPKPRPRVSYAELHALARAEARAHASLHPVPPAQCLEVPGLTPWSEPPSPGLANELTRQRAQARALRDAWVQTHTGRR